MKEKQNMGERGKFFSELKKFKRVHYMNFYKKEDYIIFSVRPGITGLASLKYRNEVELLKAAENPEEFYINTVIPDKLTYNKIYIEKRNLLFDMKLIFLSVIRVISK
ncbi:sugar transferase [Changchengzhania lutea]|uniref:sugar transferase n=1 Tax=Changchengzhania lutea TaxID=2049305 RepID=UPI00115CB462|nr:sugar transferase [Changchengzhania lutea]